ncbi:MAG: tetratricopeptide repeat protein, partial [Oceanobacter sp.]
AFVMVTGENAADMVMGALEYDPDSYLTKPITMGILEQRLKRLFAIRRVLAPVYKALDTDRLKEAAEIAETLLEQHPQMVLPITRILGKTYVRMKKFNSAIRVYSNLLNDRSVSWAWLGQAVCLHNLGDSLSAIALLKETIRKHPKYVQCYDWLARIYLTMDDKEYAQKLLEKASRISPKAVLRQRELGALALENGDVEVAAKAFEQAVRLGRHSCYKNHDAYLKFAYATLPLLEEDFITHKRLGDKAQRVLNELQSDYKSKLTICFVGLLTQARLSNAQRQPERALRQIAEAEHLYHQQEEPGVQDTLALSQAFIDNNQHIRARDLLKSMDLKALSKPDRELVNAQLQALDETVIRQHSDKINAAGVSMYEKGDLKGAMAAFDEAVEYDQAGISVLLNAIQVRLGLMSENDCPHALKRELIVQCRPLFQRIGPIGQTDERFDRYQRLKTRFTSLLQEATHEI